MRKSQPFQRSHQGYGLDAPLPSLLLPHGILWFSSPPNHPQLPLHLQLFSQLGRESADLRTDTGLRNRDPSALTLRMPTGLRTYMLAHTERSDSGLFERSVKQSFTPHSFPPLTVTMALPSAFELGVLWGFTNTGFRNYGRA